MRIGLVSTLGTPVRPDGAGSIESFVFRLSRELAARGHEVTVFASGDSSPECELVAALPAPYARVGSPEDWQTCEWLNVCRAVEESDRLDVLHSHSYLNALPLGRLARCTLVNTTHVMPHDDDARVWRAVPDAHVTALSEAQWAPYDDLKPAAVIGHGVDAADHTFRGEAAGHLCFLGRFTAGKGPLDAIAAAREVGMPLRMAGPPSDHYEVSVARHVDGERVIYDGPVGHAARDELLAGAVLLYPVNEPEPFGLVMVEAMMSGTPVAAYAIGAVPEIVEDGVTGALVPPGGDLAGAVRACLALDRAEVRARALERFGTARMADEYERLYERLAVGVPA